MLATNYFERAVLNLACGVSCAGFTPYLALFLNSPGEEGRGQEAAYGGYARQAVAFSEPSPMNGGIGVENAADITFPRTDVAVGTVSYVGVMDSITGGNMLLYCELTEPMRLEAQEAPVFAAGEAQWWITNDICDVYKAKVMNLLRGVSCAGFTPHLALYNGHPDAGGAELAGLGYARIPLIFGAPSEQASGQMMISNAQAASSARAAQSWGTYTHTVVMDAEAGGTAFGACERSVPKEMKKGVKLIVEPGKLSLLLN